MAIIWWAANKLTWDCTHLDGEREAGGQGLLMATGINQASQPATHPENEVNEPPSPSKKKKDRQKSWFEKFQAYRNSQKLKPHTPGTWVVYFGLGAVPIFILGQSLISPEDTDRRRATLMQMAVFVGSGLGLLVTTSLMGLRKYLEDRGAKVSQAMTASWLGLGGVLIVGFIALAVVLPRPHSETPIIEISKAGKQDRKASKNAVRKDESAGKGEGTAGQKKEAGDGRNNAKNGNEGGNAGKKGDGGGQGNNNGGKQKSDNNQGNQNQNFKNNPRNEPQSKDQNQSKDPPLKNDANGPNRKPDDQGDKGGDDESNESENNDGGSDSESSSPSKISESLETVGSIVKWVVWIVIAAAVIFGIFIFFIRYLSPFTAWAQGLLDWLRALISRKVPDNDDHEPNTEIGQNASSQPRFEDYTNPFRDGSAKRRSLESLVGYTHKALESWAADAGIPRETNETAREFADRISNDYPDLDAAPTLAGLVTFMAYSNRELPESTLETLRVIWAQMESQSPSRV
jgi:hypothetical protein